MCECCEWMKDTLDGVVGQVRLTLIIMPDEVPTDGEKAEAARDADRGTGGAAR